ncbi:MAG: class I SAM-dependent methyltransferase, partial [Bacteroidota bacterium]|nr:class I SAM-dependent methyltransferase [Bacteroidota bacterium]
MQYDPIKRKLGVFFNHSPFLRKTFYRLLDLLLLRAWHIRKELSQLRNALPANLTILDAGSGFGQYSYRMARLFPASTITGVDVKEEQIADCNNFFGRIGMKEKVCFEPADLTQYCRPNQFDLILSVDVMEHITEDVKVMQNFCTSLHTGGWLLISTPSDQGGSEAHDHDHGSEATGFIEEHVRDGYNIDDITRKLKEAGFSKVEAR